MKLLRYGPNGAEKPGLCDAGGVIRDLSGVIDDLDPTTISDETFARIADLDPESLPVVSGNPRIGPCVGRPGKFICIGLNYSDHAAEAGMELPPEPIIFLKATSAVCGPNDTIEIPRGSTKTDWEVELGVVIGKHAKYIDEADALDHVAGYCLINDVSERAFQLEHSGQWVKGKSADTFGPIGPWLVTRDEIADPQNLSMWLDVNGVRYQNGSTQTMAYGVAFVISYLSRFMSLQPGTSFRPGPRPASAWGKTRKSSSSPVT